MPKEVLLLLLGKNERVTADKLHQFISGNIKGDWSEMIICSREKVDSEMKNAWIRSKKKKINCKGAKKDKSRSKGMEEAAEEDIDDIPLDDGDGNTLDPSLRDSYDLRSNRKVGQYAENDSDENYEDLSDDDVDDVA